MIIKKILIALLLLISTATFAQDINWASLKTEQKHIANFNAGLDYASSFGIGYGYQLNWKLPIVLNAQLSIPAGKNLVDDFKSKLGGQVRAYKSGNFAATVLVYAILRGQQTGLVKMQSFGSEFTGVAGYYRPKWFAAAEFGFDKAIATHIKNSSIMKEYFPEIKDGWYVPTGGNFHFGIQGGYTIKTFDITVKAGKLLDQRFESTAMVPFYFQLGVSKRFRV
jgi:hypothetical protein